MEAKNNQFQRLQVEELHKSFGEKKVLQGISFSAKRGQALGILGRNGAGKTTTIRILMDVFKADSGSVLLDGKQIDYGKIHFGYLPEERGLYPKKKIMDQLVYFAQLKGMTAKAATTAVNQWLERLGMSEYRNKRLDTLSKGNQQKIQLITALVHDPEIVILDEPFSGLDPVNAGLLKDVVKEEIEKGKILLFSSHQMNYIEEFCNQIVIMNGGKIVLAGDLDEIKHQYSRDKLLIRSADHEKIKEAYGSACNYMENSKNLLLRLDDPQQKQQRMREIIETYDVDSMQVFEPSLNDIFVEYAGEDR